KGDTLRGQIDKHPSFVRGLAAPCHQSLVLEPFQHWRESAEIHPQKGGEVADPLRTALPKHHKNQVLRIRYAKLLQKGYEQASHVVAGGVEREAKVAIEPGHFHGSNRALNVRAFFLHVGSHFTDFPDNRRLAP